MNWILLGISGTGLIITAALVDLYIVARRTNGRLQLMGHTARFLRSSAARFFFGSVSALTLSFGITGIGWIVAIGLLALSSCWMLFDLISLRRAIRRL